MRRIVRHGVRVLAILAATLGGQAAWAQSSNGLCVIDVNLHLSPKANQYAYDTAASGNSINGVSLDIPGASWDVPLGVETSGASATTIMSLSYRLGAFDDGKCLDAFVIKAGSPGQGLAPITNTSVMWKSIGYWYSNQAAGMHVPTDRNVSPQAGSFYHDPYLTSDIIVAPYVRLASAPGGANNGSEWIVTALTVDRADYCPTRDGNRICAGTWQDQQGAWWRIMVTMEPYSAFANRKAVKTLSGGWVQLSRCDSCTTNFSYETGVTKGNEVSDSSTTYNSITAGLSATVNSPSSEVLPVPRASVTFSFDYTHSWEKTKMISDSFIEAKSETLQQTCAKGALYQWVSGAQLYDNSVLEAKSKVFVCTSVDDVAPATLDWNGCNGEQVFADTANVGTQPNTRYDVVSGWRCKKGADKPASLPAKPAKPTKPGSQASLPKKPTRK
jgi:hypothetical protein